MPATSSEEPLGPDEVEDGAGVEQQRAEAQDRDLLGELVDLERQER
jgi:hypothetical protein